MKTANQSPKTVVIPQSLVDAVHNQERIESAPHNFYRYPARFSPVFAREAIKAFTSTGETVLDPFCGGGTSLVEAVALGRKAVGFDISSLAAFLSTTKTAPISTGDKRVISRWVAGVRANGGGSSAQEFLAEEDYYYRNLPHGAIVFFKGILHHVNTLQTNRQRMIARLALLSVGQWALDCKRGVPAAESLLSKYCDEVTNFAERQFQYSADVAAANNLPQRQLAALRRIINASCECSDKRREIPADWLPAKLVLTSPPYPGVHVLYHRWQIDGRKETPAPFLLANCRDGDGESFYCLGRRQEPELKTYFERLGKAFTAVRKLVGPESIVAQLVAFSNVDWQLPAYLEKMEESGFVEMLPDCDEDYLFEDRLWRQVPGRKWYANNKGGTGGSREVLLLHKPR